MARFNMSWTYSTQKASCGMKTVMTFCMTLHDSFRPSRQEAEAYLIEKDIRGNVR